MLLYIHCEKLCTFCFRVAFFIAEVCLLAGSVRNAYHTKYRSSFLTSDKPLSCETLRKGVFAAGAAFIFFTSIISQFYYVSYAKARGGPMPYGGEAGVGMAAYKWGWSRLLLRLFVKKKLWFWSSCIIYNFLLRNCIWFIVLGVFSDKSHCTIFLPAA